MNYNEITDLKDKHKGQDIYVILAGSSMDYVPPKFFDNKIVIGQNQVFKHFKCDYVVMKDCLEEPRFPRSIKQLKEKNIPLVFSKWFKGHQPKGLNTPNYDGAYVFDHNPRCEELSTELEELREDEILVSKSSVTSLIHLAAYMGASNIILCGHDCGTLDNNLYYKGYLEPDWKSSGNWNGITAWMSTVENDTTIVKKYLEKRYNCCILSLNPFINLGLDGHEYKAL